MQKIKHFLRTVGHPANENLGVQSADDVEAELEYKFLNQGWVKNEVMFLGSVRDDKGSEVGYRFMYIMTKEDASAKAK